ncbi:NAPE-hydrolyzing phospholipase D [Xylariales sp. AK1849]|nr:NAPE-hydrolyzing phospholipase D [Xylariales sp. AK1849]
MRSIIRFFSRPCGFQASEPIKAQRHTTHRASIAASTLALPLAMYSSTVTKPAKLGPVPEDTDAKSHHVRNWRGETTKFQNPHASFQTMKRWDLFNLLWDKNTGGTQFPKPTGTEVTVMDPEFLSSRKQGNELRATWLGHACYYVEFPSGLRVLFDPVFEDCCAPFSFLGFQRFTKPACQISELPFVDAVCISHSHYDHLSYPTVNEIRDHHPEAHFFVGLGLKKWFNKCGIEGVTEMDWWEDVEISLMSSDEKGASETKSVTSSAGSQNDSSAPITARISCLPCQHGSGRSPFDQNQTLWASWAVSSAPLASPETAKSVWFGGDTGYRSVPRLPPGVDDYAPPHDTLPTCPQFAQIGDLRGPFDLGLIPIGAYAPRHVFSNVHGNPFDAVEIFRDTRCKRAMSIHWGTWVLTSEDVEEPPRLLREALKRRGIDEEKFGVCKVGETREF